jgi:hypothetical protein
MQGRKGKRTGNTKISSSLSADEMLRRFPMLAEAARSGVDIKMLMDNLKRPVGERIRRHGIALSTIKRLQRAAKHE